MEGFLLLLLLIIYFLPTIIGWNKKQIGGIFVINLFLGWTFLGWIIALAWACASSTIQQKQSPAPKKFSAHPSMGYSEVLPCPNCQKDIPKSAKFCGYCWKHIRSPTPKETKLTVCPDCEQAVSRLATVCPHCGRPLNTPA
ncbi:MAG: superinfection immunity protein [Gammaproteobacteria bacterium]